MGGSGGRHAPVRGEWDWSAWRRWFKFPGAAAAKGIVESALQWPRGVATLTNKKMSAPACPPAEGDVGKQNTRCCRARNRK